MALDNISHEKLVTLSSRWLSKRHPIVITELVCGAGEQADAIGFTSGYSTLIECKISRPDYLTDKNKIWRRMPETALGDFRYYCCPKNLINYTELPEGWGLLEAGKRGLIETHKPQRYEYKSDCRKEMSILFSVLRRIGQNPPKGISIRCYTIESKNKATITFNNKK